jgi:uncharacterized Zn finger protein
MPFSRIDPYFRTVAERDQGGFTMQKRAEEKETAPPAANPAQGFIADRWLAWIDDDPTLKTAYGKRLRRGKILATTRRNTRTDPITNLTVSAGVITAVVQGDGEEPHDVRIRMDLIDGPVWEGVLDATSEEAALRSEILGGRLSKRIIEMFDDIGDSLFPFDIKDLKNYCKCQEEGFVCTGAVAVHFRFAELIQADPMKLLHFRGRDRDALAHGIRERRARHQGEGETAAPAIDAEDALFERGSNLTRDFWGGVPLPTLQFQMADIGPLQRESMMPTLRALGRGPNGSHAEPLIIALEPMIKAARYRIDQQLEAAEREHELDLPEVEMPIPVEPAPAPTPTNAAPSTKRTKRVQPVEATPAPAPPQPPQEDESLDDMIVEAARKRGALTTQFVAEALDIEQKDAREYLQYLVSQGRLVVSGKGRGTRYLPL